MAVGRRQHSGGQRKAEPDCARVMMHDKTQKSQAHGFRKSSHEREMNSLGSGARGRSKAYVLTSAVTGPRCPCPCPGRSRSLCARSTLLALRICAVCAVWTGQSCLRGSRVRDDTRCAQRASADRAAAHPHARATGRSRACHAAEQARGDAIRCCALLCACSCQGSSSSSCSRS